MLRRTGTLILLLLTVGSHFQFSRGQEQVGAILAYRTTDHAVWAFRFDENPLMDYDHLLRLHGTVVAARFCSPDSLKTSVNIYRAQLAGLMNFLQEAYDYTPDRLVILQASACPKMEFSPAAELWVIPEGAEIPSSRGMVSGCQLSEIFKVKKKGR